MPIRSFPFFCSYLLGFCIQLVKDKGDGKDLVKGVRPDIMRKLKVPAIKLITRIASIVLFFKVQKVWFTS